MTQEVAYASIDYIASHYPINTGIIFFGGEPLLKKELIKDTIAYCKHKEKNSKAYFHYKVTTNGTLLDHAFLDFAKESELQVSLSIDGNRAAHDTFRKFPDGSSSFDLIEKKAALLLSYQPYAKALMTVTPESLPYYCDSVEYLLEQGFRYVVVSLNYAGSWEEHHLKMLKEQYRRIAHLYEKYILKEKKFYFSPFEMKLASHIRQANLECYQCHLGKKQLSISHTGEIYPCVQFVKDGLSNTSYRIGNIQTGIDESLRESMYASSQEPDPNCLNCDYHARCNNKCSCMNWQLTGQLNRISPLVCETERILIPLVDKMGERLYKKGAAMFIQKHYNAVYPIISMLEDM